MFNDHKVVFKALVGSHNYNLNDEDSDKDWKYFVLPTFDDLYSGAMYSSSKVGAEEDYSVHDIRKLVQLFWKSNINFLEVLFSKEYNFYGLSGDDYHLLSEVWNIKDEIAVMNLPYLYSACKGMYFEKMKRLEQGTENTQHLVKKFGYDTKQALHAYRVLDFCMCFVNSEWDFSNSIQYFGAARDFMLDIKHGHLSLAEFRRIADVKYNTFLEYEASYRQHEPNEETKAKLESIIKELVRRNI